VFDQLRIPIWGEARLALEHAALRRHPVFRGEGITRGDGTPVLLVPGFLAGDVSLGIMAEWLTRMGYRPCRAGIRVNVDCMARGVERLEHQLERFANRYGRMVTIVGQSRGGSMARVLAVRRPDLVTGVICLGSPIVDELAVHPWVRAQVETVALLGSLGFRGLFSHGCKSGSCCTQARADIVAPWPAHILFTSVYSRSDGIVNWRACLDPHARQVEVGSSHVGMAVNPTVYEVVAEALSAPRSDPVRAAA
jgi:triacylglycerol lipase